MELDNGEHTYGKVFDEDSAEESFGQKVGVSYCERKGTIGAKRYRNEARNI